MRPARPDVRDESGQTLTEYTMILLLVLMVALIGLTSIGKTVDEFLRSVAGLFPG